MTIPTQQPGGRAEANLIRLAPLSPTAGSSFPVDHPYFEVVYMPLMGPSAISLMRRLDWLLRSAGGPVTVDTVTLASELGLRAGHTEPIGARSPFGRSLNRLAHAHLVRWLGPQDLGVMPEIPILSSRRVASLPTRAQDAHRTFLRRGEPPPTDRPLRVRHLTWCFTRLARAELEPDRRHFLSSDAMALDGQWTAASG